MPFKEGQFGFEQDCLLDPNMMESSITLSTFEQYIKENRIEALAVLPNDILRRLYNLIRNAEHLIRKIKLDIHANMNKIGIYNLRKP